MIKLTDGRGGTIAKVQPPKKGTLFMRIAPNLELRVTEAGGKAIVWRGSIDGKQARITLGSWPAWSVKASMLKAQELNLQVSQGIDPREKARRRRAEPTVGEVYPRYFDNCLSGLLSEGPANRYFERDVLPVIGKRKLSEVTARDIRGMVEMKAAKRKTAALRLLAHLKGLFGWCVDQEYLQASPAAGIKPRSIATAGRKGLAPKKRFRVLTDEEIYTFWAIAEVCGIHPLTAILLKLILLTGQRPGEVAGMHESEIHGDSWDIPAVRRGKTLTDQRVPLTPEARELIERAQKISARRNQTPTGHIFEARPGKPITVAALSKAVSRYAEALGNHKDSTWGEWRPHDLRRTARTGLSACGVSEEIAERVIGHGSQGMVAVYNQYDYDKEKRMALEAWSRRLNMIIAGKDPDAVNVVPFNRAQA